MNEPINTRLQELLELFLHRGCSPEEEKELFDACLNDPNAAEAVRQQLVLSLKIRSLRDKEEVPAEVRNELFRKINTLTVEEETETAPERKRAFAWLGAFRLGWSHALVAGAAAVLAVFIVMNSAEEQQPLPQTAAVTEVVDTVRVHSVDTVREVERVRVPVYIEKSSIAKDETPETATGQQRELAEPGTPGSVKTIAAQDGQPEETESTTEMSGARDELRVGSSNYLAQYNRMVATMDKIELTEEDRVRL